MLRIGDLNNTGSIQIAGPISPAAATLSLLARGSISQTAGATVTATNLRARSSRGSVTLTENNSVGTLAGGTGFSSFTFTGHGPACDRHRRHRRPALTGNSATIRSDTLTIPNSIFTSSTTLAPRTAAAAIVLGTPGAAFGITDARDG